MIEVVGVSKKFLTQAVLHQVSFQMDRGETFVVLGQSGVGKTVFLKLMAGLINPDEGYIHIQTKKIGMLFQKNALFDSLNVYENLDFSLRENTKHSIADRKTIILQYLEWVGLKDTGALFPHELSGGMQKRLGIARALITRPEVILYDEPTAGLDPITSRMIIDLIVRLKEEMGTTVIVVTSDVLRAYQMANRISLLVKGPSGASLVIAGTPAETRSSTHAAVNQFVHGHLKGPLTGANPMEDWRGTDSHRKRSSLRTLSIEELCAELDNDPF